MQPQKCKVSVFSGVNAAKTICAEKQPGRDPGRVRREMLPPLPLQPALLHPCGTQSRKAEITRGISALQRRELGVRAAESSVSGGGTLLWFGTPGGESSEASWCSVSAAPAPGEPSARREAPPGAAASAAWRDSPGQDLDSHQRTQMKPTNH